MTGGSGELLRCFLRKYDAMRCDEEGMGFQNI